MIVSAGIAHADTLASIHAAAFGPDAWDAASFATLLAQPGVQGLIDERGGFVLIRLAADEAEILTFAACPPRLGIGGGLLAAAIAWARPAAKTIFLEVAADNLPACALYRKAGFTQSAIRKNYYRGGRDALLLKLAL